MDAIDATCQSCYARFNTSPKRTFLGFQKMRCPNCNAKVIYPLTYGCRVVYWIMCSLLIVSVYGTFARGGIGFPGGIGIAVLIALFRDRFIQRRVKVAEALSPSG